MIPRDSELQGEDVDSSVEHTVDGPAKSPGENGGKHPMISHDLEGFNMFEPSKIGAGFRWPIVEALGVSLRDLDHETGLGLLQVISSRRRG